MANERLCGWRRHPYAGDCYAPAVAVVERLTGAADETSLAGSIVRIGQGLRMTRRMTVAAVAVLSVVGLLAAFIPARRASLVDPAATLREQ